MLVGSLNKLNVLNLVVFCITIAFLLSLSHCHRDQPKPKTELEKLPAATQTGAYTFGCLVNGKAWIPQSSVDFSCDNEVNFALMAKVSTSTIKQSFGFYIANQMTTTGSYQLNDSTKQYADFADFSDATKLCEYIVDGSTGNGILIITKFDQTRLIVSGTFSLTTWNTKCDTIRITDGRFDLHFIP